MRLELESAMGSLASVDIQGQVWPNPPPFCGFDLVVHTLFDDVNIHESDDPALDYGLNSVQVDAIKEVMSILDVLWERLGINAKPHILRGQPEWIKVVAAANLYMSSSNAPENYKAHFMSAEEYGKKSGLPNPFVDPSDELYLRNLKEGEERYPKNPLTE